LLNRVKPSYMWKRWDDHLPPQQTSVCVRVLADEGFSQREIAERVFGERRYHGRVERILKRARAAAGDPTVELSELLARLETLRTEPNEEEIPDLDQLVDLGGAARCRNGSSASRRRCASLSWLRSSSSSFGSRTCASTSGSAS
jgi:hypothetical protein